jgi:hypothetical protein
VVYGSETPTNIDLATLGTAGFRIDGANAGDRSGYSVAVAGAVNGDGYADLLIGAPLADPSGKTEAGTSYVVYGSQTPTDIDLAKLDTGFRIDGAKPGDRSGHSVAAAGDVNGDGYVDLLIGAPYAAPSGKSSAGSSFVINGRETPTNVDLGDLFSAGFRINGANDGDNSGYSVAGAGDMNSDGYADLLIGAPYASLPGKDYAGVSFVVYGGDETTDIDLATLHTGGFGINGANTFDRSGLSVAGTGDVNKDGKADLLIGSPNADYAGRVDSGASYLLLNTPPVFTAPGAPTGVTGTPGDAQVQLSWIPPNSDGGAPISGYQIETATGGGPWTIATTTGASTTTTLTGLTNGTGYQFRIAAINPAGAGPASEASGTLIPRTIPGAPTGVTGTPGDAQVQLSWIPPNSDGGAPISGYQIETATGGGPWTITTTTGPATTTTLTGLINGTSYQFRIAAINPAGVGPASKASGTLIPAPMPTPATLSVTARAASKAVPKTGKVRLVRKVTVGPGQTASIAVRVAPKRTKKKVTVTKTATAVKVRTKRAPKGKVTVRITSSGTGYTPVTWTRTWTVR